MAKKLVSLLPWFGAIFHPQNWWSHYEDGKTRCLFPSWLNSSGLFYYHIIVGILLNCWLLLSISEKMKDVSVKLGKISIVANTWLVLRWMCDSPRTGCARRITLIYTWREQANNRVMVACNLYCCLLPQCEALHACRSGFPIATLPSFALRPCDQRLGQVEVKSPHLVTICFDKLWVQLGTARVGDTVGNMVVNYLLLGDFTWVFGPNTTGRQDLRNICCEYAVEHKNFCCKMLVFLPS